jgi:predicted transport protein
MINVRSWCPILPRNMTEKPVIVTKDGVYQLYKYQSENDLERLVVKHASEIFGKDTVYFDLKRKISSKSGFGTIPDGYVIDLKQNKLYLIEVELIRHSLKRHVLPQITNFIMALDNKNTVEKLVNEFLQELPPSVKINESKMKDIVNNWGIIIVIDDVGDPMKDTNPLLEIVNFLSVHGEVKAIPFQTYSKNGKLTDDLVHSFKSFTKEELEQEAKKWSFKWETVDVENHLEKTTDDIKDVFAKLSEKICCIAPEVKEVHRKKWTTYQLSALKNFCTVKVQDDHLEINLKMDESVYDDKKGIAKSIKRTPAWTFDKVLQLSSEKDIDYVVTLIEQAHKSITLKK